MDQTAMAGAGGMEKCEVIHDTEQRRFVVALGESEAYLSYSLDDRNHTIDFQHTFVPRSMRGKVFVNRFAFFTPHLLL